ncbi:cytochrome P450 705A12-like [Tripterygium wilfordii]|uniref:cytochrome P450 705A12-like n=1 Tax=Tripterygium wilfordii TaxID=458696 RepID=UPI0018F7E5ED|nr:cytochrome P450 705A12-like [Tripterygium wilfordii]
MATIIDLMQYSFLFLMSILFLLTIQFLIQIFINKRGKVRHPPSPQALPLFGHIHLLSSSLPKSFQTLARKYGPLMQIRIYTSTFLVVSNPNIAEEILKTQDIYFGTRFETCPTDYNIYRGSGFIASPFGAYWRFMRKLSMTKLFNGPQLNRFNHIREQEIETLLKFLMDCSRRGATCDLNLELESLMNNIICRMVMSKRFSNNAIGAKQLKKLVAEVMDVSARFGVNQVFGFLKKFDILGTGKMLKAVMLQYDELLEEIMKEYEENILVHQDGSRNEEKDVMDILLETYRDPNAEVKITRNQIKFFIMELLFASIDTTSAAIQWAMAELINSPSIFKKLREEINSVVGSNRLVKESDVPDLPYLQSVIKESLRLHPPSTFLRRECTKDCKINGYDVNAGSRIMINVYGIMRDPDSWNDPGKFMPERFMESNGQDFRYLPFGGGRRGCVGTKLSYLVMNATIGALVQCFDWQVKDGERVDIRVGAGFTGAMTVPMLCYPITCFDPFH